jgi:hypothetical protein
MSTGRTSDLQNDLTKIFNVPISFEVSLFLTLIRNQKNNLHSREPTPR